MATIIMKFITIVMSISMFFTSTVPAFISSEDYKVIDPDTISINRYGVLIPSEEKTHYEIISNYDEWKTYSEKHHFETESYDEKYFETKSLVSAEFIINDGLCELHVVNAAETNNTLELNCNIYHHYGASINYATYYTLIIETNKNTETVDISTNSINIPFEPIWF